MRAARPIFREPKVRWVRWWERLLVLHKPMRVGAQEGSVIWYKIRWLGTMSWMLVHALAEGHSYTEVGLVHRERQAGRSRTVSVPNIFRALRMIVVAKAALHGGRTK